MEAVAAIILGWNPERWADWSYPRAIEDVRETGLHRVRWTVPDRSALLHVVAASSQTEAWLLLQGRRPGLIGHGVIASVDPESGTLNVAFDGLLPLGDHVPLSLLEDRMPECPWASTGSGEILTPRHAALIRSVWAEAALPSEADPTAPVPGSLPEEILVRVAANRYEQSINAREACIAHHGTSCAACGFSFERVYGEIGRDFIQVHHIVPAYEIRSDYQLDPVTDLVPLCPNCHAMAHRGTAIPRTPAELRTLIARAGYVPGVMVTAQEQQAHDEAVRLLGIPYRPDGQSG